MQKWIILFLLYVCLKCVSCISSVNNLHPNTCDFQIATAHISQGHNLHNETIAAPAQSAKCRMRADCGMRRLYANTCFKSPT